MGSPRWARSERHVWRRSWKRMGEACPLEEQIVVAVKMFWASSGVPLTDANTSP